MPDHILSECEQPTRAFEHGNIERGQGLPHHRPAHDDLTGVIPDLTMAKHITNRRPDRNDEIGRTRHARTRDRDDALDECKATIKVVGQCRQRGDVVDDDAQIERELPGRHLLAEDGFDQHLLGPLRILDLQWRDTNLSAGGDHTFQCRDRIRLVQLNSDRRRGRNGAVRKYTYIENLDSGKQLRCLGEALLYEI